MLPGLGWRAYASNPSNDFDAVVVVLSFVEIGIGTYSPHLALFLFAPVASSWHRAHAKERSVSSWVHLFVTVAGSSSGSTSTGILRSFRALRVLKLAKSTNSLRVLLAAVAECIGSWNVAYMTLLLFLFVFMFAVMGVQGAGLRPGI